MGHRLSAAPRSQDRVPADWILYVLVLAAARCLPGVLQAGGWMPEAGRMVSVALWGCVAGVIMARTCSSAPYAWSLSMLIGMIYAGHLAGRILPPLEMVFRDLQSVAAWVRIILSRPETWPDPPLSFSLAHIGIQGATLFTNIGTWVSTARSGAVNTDNTALILGISFGTWGLCWNAGFQAGRSGDALAGLVPLGLATLIAVSLTGLGLFYAQVYLVIALLAWLWACSGQRLWLWRVTRVSVAPWLRARTFLAGLPLSGLILALALVIPYRAYDSAAVWERAGERLHNVYEWLDRAFAGHGIIPRPSRFRVITVPAEVAATPILGRLEAHDIGTGMPLGDEVVFRVQTSDDSSHAPEQVPPRHYWRERTYDRYTGRGWSSSAAFWAPFPAQARWKEVEYPHTTLTQTFTLPPQMSDAALAVNEPVFVSQPYRLLTRGSGDLAGLAVGQTPYTVVSLVPNAAAQDLRAAEGEYPAWIVERYLPLPDVPAKIQEAAQAVVRRAGATTRYDQARAIEAYLRGFTYDLNLPPPPAGADVVGYYLTTGRGYCEYAATAMVVMLRSLGIAARYAVGYGPGEYDAAGDAWVVRARNAHAWPEVYFPGYGWVEFEPTPSEPLSVRPETLPTPASEGRPNLAPSATNAAGTNPSSAATNTLAPQQARQTASTPGASSPRSFWSSQVAPFLGTLLVGGGVLLLLAFVLVGPARGWGLSRDPREAIRQLYGQLLLYARGVGAVPRNTHTPREALALISRKVARRSRLTSEVAHDLAMLGRLYERARYGQDAPAEADREHALAAWQRLRPALVRAIFSRVRTPSPPSRPGR